MAVDDFEAVKVDTPGYFYALYNDYDPDGYIDYNSAQTVDSPLNGSVYYDSSSSAFVYTPSPGYVGPDSFTYTVADNEGAVSNVATVTIDVVPNQPPTANDDYASVKSDTSQFLYVIYNDYDPDGNIDYNSAQTVDSPLNGTVAYDASNQAFFYTPNPGYAGPDSFSYTVADDNGAVSNVAMVTIDVVPNQPPTAIDDSATVVADTMNALDILVNDFDPDGSVVPSSFALVSGPSNGTVAYDYSAGAPVYTPNPGYTGPDSFSYTVSDDNGAVSNVASVTLDIVPNQPPVAVDDQFTAFQDHSQSFNVLDNDYDPVGKLVPSSLSIVSPPSHGSLSIDPFSGAVQYTPDSGFVGTDTFSYTVTDNSGAVSNVATATLAVYQNLQVTDGGQDPAGLVNALLDSNPQLSIVPGSIQYVGTSDQAGTYSGLDFGSTLSIANGILLTSGSAKLAEWNDSSGTTGGGSTDGDPDLSALINGTPTYGANILEFDFLVDEGVQSIAFDFIFGSEEFPEWVGSYNDVFGVFLDGVQIAYDGDGKAVTVNNNFFLLNNTDPNDTTDPDTVGKTVIDLNTIEYDGLTPRLTTNVGVTPGQHHIKFAIADAGDNVLDSGVFIASLRALKSGGGGGGTTGQPPVAEDDEAHTVGTQPVVIDVLTNDSDPDGTVDPTTVAIDTPPANGNVSVDPVTGLVTYTANPGFSGTDSFTYTVKDNDGVVSNAGLVSVEVAAPLTITDVRVLVGSQSVSLSGIGRTLPWANISAIQITFNQDAVVDINDLKLTGIKVANYAFSSFSYDESTHTAMWTLAARPDADRLILALDGDDATSDGNEGVALPGGDYSLDFSVLVGDFNGDGVVTIADTVGIRNHTPAYGTYDIWADIDGDGDVDLDDINLARSRIRNRLP